MIFSDRHKKYQIENESELVEKRITSQREIQQLELQKKAEEAQHKRDQAKLRAYEELHYIQENKKRIAYYKQSHREQVAANKWTQKLNEVENRLHTRE